MANFLNALSSIVSTATETATRVDRSLYSVTRYGNRIYKDGTLNHTVISTDLKRLKADLDRYKLSIGFGVTLAQLQSMETEIATLTDLLPKALFIKNQINGKNRKALIAMYNDHGKAGTMTDTQLGWIKEAIDSKKKNGFKEIKEDDNSDATLWDAAKTVYQAKTKEINSKANAYASLTVAKTNTKDPCVITDGDTKYVIPFALVMQQLGPKLKIKQLGLIKANKVRLKGIDNNFTAVEINAIQMFIMDNIDNIKTV